MGTAIIVQAEKNNSRVFTQLLTGLDKMENPLVNETEQVKLQSVIVPEIENRLYRSTMLVTHVQDAMEETVNPMVDVQFGPFGNIAGSMSEYGYGSLQIFKTDNCMDQAAATPYFAGTLNNVTKYSLVNALLKDKAIQFHVLRLSMDLKKKEVQDMDLAISTLGFDCINSADVEQQFTDNVNKALVEMLNKASDNPTLQMLSPLLK